MNLLTIIARTSESLALDLEDGKDVLDEAHLWISHLTSDRRGMMTVLSLMASGAAAFEIIERRKAA